MLLKNIYDNSPSFLQNIFLTLQALKYRCFRFGGRFSEFREFLVKSQGFSEDQMDEWRLKRFREVFGEAYDNTKYYREIFDNAKIDPRSVEDFSFLKQLPILSKESLRDLPDEFLNRSRRIVYVAKTGGTTGSPLPTPYDAESTQWASAFLERFFENSGIKRRDRNIHMTGQQICPPNEQKEFWRTDFFTNTLYLSVHHLGPDTFDAYWKKILRFKPVYVFGYTSFIYELARLVNVNNKSGQLKLGAVFPSSEKLTDQMRFEIERAFSCRVYDHYGSTEGIPLITQCSKGSYHVVPESGIIEFLNRDGEPAKSGEPAEMFMTSFRQLARPILRYRIGDTAILSDVRCECGLFWPVIEQLTGRLSEWITLEDGRRISQFSHQVFKTISNVEESQIVQHEYRFFEIIIVKSSSYQQKDEINIRERIFELIGRDVKILFTYTDAIKRTSGGKKPSLISNVK